MRLVPFFPDYDLPSLALPDLLADDRQPKPVPSAAEGTDDGGLTISACADEAPIPPPSFFTNQNKKRRGQTVEYRFALECMERDIPAAQPYLDCEKYDAVILPHPIPQEGLDLDLDRVAQAPPPVHSAAEAPMQAAVEAPAFRPVNNAKKKNGASAPEWEQRHPERDAFGRAQSLPRARRGDLGSRPARVPAVGTPKAPTRASDRPQFRTSALPQFRTPPPAAKGQWPTALVELTNGSVRIRVARVQVRSAFAIHNSAYDIPLTCGANSEPYRLGDFEILAAYVAPHRAWYIIPAQALVRRQINEALVRRDNPHDSGPDKRGSGRPRPERSREERDSALADDLADDRRPTADDLLQTSISLYPHIPGSRGRFEKFRERWDLLS